MAQGARAHAATQGKTARLLRDMSDAEIHLPTTKSRK
jgi:hypothetical protein